MRSRLLLLAMAVSLWLLPLLIPGWAAEKKSLLPAGKGKSSSGQPLRITSPGDQKFIVGGIATAGSTRFRISHMKLRNGRVVRREGKGAAAREITRMYGYCL